MSLGGIAIAIGTMIDAGIVMVENAHKHLEREEGTKPRHEILIDAATEVGPSLFFSLLVITVSFLPIFALEAQEGRLFKPLAFTKTWAMAGAALLSITVVPALMVLFVRGRIRPASSSPLNRAVLRTYRPLLERALRHRIALVAVALVVLTSSAWPLTRIGAEFMPPLDEGDLLYMPTTLPGLSITKAREVLQQTDRIIASFPEVERVFGKAGRAETATDPAPLSMIETVIMLRPRDEWREGMTTRKLIAELDRATTFPGLTNAWTMPIKTRIDMLSTGINTPVGLKLAGSDLETLQTLGERLEAILRSVPGTASVSAERVAGGNYLDLEIDREQIARYGLTVGDVQDVIQIAIGGMNISETVEGLERYSVNLRYSRELRDDLASLRRVLVPTPAGAQVPLEQLARLEFKKGPPGIKSENARERECATQCLDPNRSRGRRRRDLRRPGEGGDRRTRRDPFWIYAHLERPIRISGPGDRSSQADRTHHPRDHLRTGLPELPAGHGRAARARLPALCARRRALPALGARLRLQRRGGRRLPRPRRPQRRDQPDHAPLPEPGPGAGEGRGAPREPRGPLPGDRRRSDEPGPPPASCGVSGRDRRRCEGSQRRWSEASSPRPSLR
jgi:Cu/Ag efflux pump CusA